MFMFSILGVDISFYSRISVLIYLMRFSMDNEQKKQAIIVFGDTFTFPEGNAATNRVHTFAKGFLENKLAAFVICFRNEYTENIEGTFEGIGYCYPYGQKVRNKHFLIRRWVKLRKYLKTYQSFKGTQHPK